MDEKKFNWLVIDTYSKLLNEKPRYVTADLINEISSIGIKEEEAYQIIIGALFGLDIDKEKELFNVYIKEVIKKLDINSYITNPYYENIKFDIISYKGWSLGYEEYKPYEAFVYNDFKRCDDKILPCIGYFNESFKYPAIYYKNRLWMSICPNEINTMAKDISDAFGNVLIYGLGLGYYPYMLLSNTLVKSITIVEIDKNVIDFFRKYILPQFPENNIKIINADALEYGRTITKEVYDFVFTDIWHDASDAVELYKRFKQIEKNGIVYRYWIYDTIKYYL